MLPWNVDPAQVLITTGSQQGLDLVAKVLIDAGSRVLVETPTYLGALQAFSPMEPEVVSVASDDEGVVVDDLDGQGARRPLPLPAAQLPEPDRPHHERAAPRRGVATRRASWACRSSRTTPTATCGSTTAPPLPLTARNPDGCIYLGSFSKVLAPGLRLGFLVAPKSLYPKLLQAKQAADLHSPSFNQRMVAEVMKDGFLDRHVPTIRALYKRSATRCWPRCSARCRAWTCMEHAGRRHVPVGCACPQGVNAVELLPKAVERGVAFVPGRLSTRRTATRARCACRS